MLMQPSGKRSSTSLRQDQPVGGNHHDATRLPPAKLATASSDFSDCGCATRSPRFSCERFNLAGLWLQSAPGGAVWLGQH